MSNEIDFNKVYKEFQPKLLRYLTRLTGAQEAEDIVQEVFNKVNRSLEGFKGESKLSTWLYRIATNTALDRLRSPDFKRASEYSLLESSAVVADKNVWTGHPKVLTDQNVIRKEMSECVREYIEKLSPEYKTVIILSELEELKNREIADILQVSLEMVKTRLHRARARLKELLDNGCTLYHNEQNILACDRKPAPVKSKKSN